MITAACPGCLKPVPVEQELCPHCGRPRDENEIELGRDLARRELLARRQRPRKLVALAVAAAAAAGASSFAWLNRGPAVAAFKKARTDFAAEVERVRDPRSQFKVRDRTDEASPAADPVELTATLTAAPPAAPPAAPAPAPTAVPQRVPPPPFKNYRRVYGVVYDAATLKPVAATIVFTTDSGLKATATTDAAGHYMFDTDRIYRDGEISISVTPVPGYREGMIEEGNPPLLDRPEDSRQKTIEETTDFDLGPAPLRIFEDQQVIEANFAVIPEARR